MFFSLKILKIFQLQQVERKRRSRRCIFYMFYTTIKVWFLEVWNLWDKYWKPNRQKRTGQTAYYSFTRQQVIFPIERSEKQGCPWRSVPKWWKVSTTIIRLNKTFQIYFLLALINKKLIFKEFVALITSFCRQSRWLLLKLMSVSQ